MTDKEQNTQTTVPLSEESVLRAAAAIANARGGRRGAPPITNVLDILPSKLFAEVTEDARAALRAVADAPPLAERAPIDADVMFCARNIVNQILDESGVDVVRRQAINDKCDDFAYKLIASRGSGMEQFRQWFNGDIFKSLDREHAHMATWVEGRKPLLKRIVELESQLTQSREDRCNDNTYSDERIAELESTLTSEREARMKAEEALRREVENALHSYNKGYDAGRREGDGP